MSADIISGVIVIMISLFFGINTMKFNASTSTDLGAQFMPRVYVGLLIFLSLLMIIKSIKDKNKEKSSYSKSTFIVMALLSIYILVMPYLGFYISTPIFIFILLRYLKIENRIIYLGIPIGMTAFIYVFFNILLKVSLPMGIIFS